MPQLGCDTLDGRPVLRESINARCVFARDFLRRRVSPGHLSQGCRLGAGDQPTFTGTSVIVSLPNMSITLTATV
jgi:hypothetical protein